MSVVLRMLPMFATCPHQLMYVWICSACRQEHRKFWGNRITLLFPLLSTATLIPSQPVVATGVEAGEVVQRTPASLWPWSLCRKVAGPWEPARSLGQSTFLRELEADFVSPSKIVSCQKKHVLNHLSCRGLTLGFIRVEKQARNKSLTATASLQM